MTGEHIRGIPRTYEKEITLADTPYTLSVGFNCVKVDTTGGNVRVNLPNVNYPIDVIKTSSDSYIVTVWVGGTQIGEVAGELSKITIENAEVTKDEPWFPYDAIVGIAGVSGDGGEVLAKNKYGRVITGGRGVAGTDDYIVINNALSAYGHGPIYVIASLIKLNGSVIIPEGRGIIAQNGGYAGTSADYPVWLVNTPIGIDIGGSSHTIRYRLENISFLSYGAQTNTAIRVRQGDYLNFENLFFINFSKGIDLQCTWNSYMQNIQSIGCNYPLYFTAVDSSNKTADLTITKFRSTQNKRWAIYAEPSTLNNVRIFGDLIEQVASGTENGGVYLAVGNERFELYSMYMAANNASQYVFQNEGKFCKIQGGRINAGIIKLGQYDLIGGGLEISLTSGIDVGNTYTTISECTFYACVRESIISVLANWCKITNNKFINSNCKYYINLGTYDSNSIVDNTLVGCNNNDAYAAADAYAIYLDPTNSIDNEIHGNKLYSTHCISHISPRSANNRIYKNTGYPTDAYGSSTGTGSEQTIAHGLVAAPSKVVIVPTETGATVSSWWADATNIYCTVTTGKAFNWSAEV